MREGWERRSVIKQILLTVSLLRPEGEMLESHDLAAPAPAIEFWIGDSIPRLGASGLCGSPCEANIRRKSTVDKVLSGKRNLQP